MVLPLLLVGGGCLYLPHHTKPPSQLMTHLSILASKTSPLLPTVYMIQSVVFFHVQAREIHRCKFWAVGLRQSKGEQGKRKNGKCLIDFRTAIWSCLEAYEAVKKKKYCLKRTQRWWEVGRLFCAGCLLLYKSIQMQTCYPVEIPWHCIICSESHIAHSSPAGALQNTFLSYQCLPTSRCHQFSKG